MTSMLGRPIARSAHMNTDRKLCGVRIIGHHVVPSLNIRPPGTACPATC